jgi:UDP-N-acetylmuramyl pentapeptide synthase
MSEDQVRIAASHEELARFVREEARKGDWILFKGSRGMGMEKVLSLFKAPGE